MVALEKLSIDSPLEMTALPDLASTSREQKDALKEYLGLLTSEPVVLAHAVNGQFFSRPELIADEKGRRLPAHTDKYISAAFFEVLHGAIQAAANWNYAARLTELLSRPAADKLYRSVVLQELTNACHLEYGRAQAAFKRHVQVGTGAKYFRRVTNALDKAGNARVTMKGKSDDHTRSDPQLHCMLRLCQADTNASKAVKWVKRISDLHEAHPLERGRLSESEADAFSGLVVIASFIHDLSSIVSLSSLSRKDGQTYISRSQTLETDLIELKKKVDLRDFVIPIDNLLEPGVAAGALEALDSFVMENASAKLGLLYYDVADECVAGVEERYRPRPSSRERKWTLPPPPRRRSRPPPSRASRQEAEVAPRRGRCLRHCASRGAGPGPGPGPIADL